MEWNGGMEWWNGMVEWNGGMEWWKAIVEWTTGMVECFLGHTSSSSMCCSVNSELYAVFFACIAGWMVG